MTIGISRNFSLEELTASATARVRGIKNVPTTRDVVNLCALVHYVLQPLRDWVGRPVGISSGYRCAALNKAVGGVGNSQHTKGEAADISIAGNMELGKKWFDWIKRNCEFDQLIWEHNSGGVYWIHVSYRADGNNRKQVIDNLLKK